MNTVPSIKHDHRLLGSTEQLFYKMRDYGGINTLSFAHGKISNIDSPIFDLSRLKIALKKLQSDSFLLSSTIKNLNGSPAFCRCNQEKLPLKVIHDADQHQFNKQLEDALSIHYDDAHVLWSVTIIYYKNDPRKFSIIAAFDHSIADGTSLCYFIDSLMRTYIDSSNVDKTEDKPLSLPKSIEPDLESFTKYKITIRDILNFAPNEISKMIFPPMQPKFLSHANFEERITKTQHEKFSEEKSAKLISLSRKNGSTVHGLLVAAFLFVAAKQKWLEIESNNKSKSSPSNLKLSTTNNISFRKDYGIPNQQTGVYISAVNSQFKLSKNTDIWQLAKSVNQSIAFKKEKKLHISSTLIFEWLQRLMSDAFRVNLLNNHTQGRLETLCVSNVGKLNITGCYDDIELTDIGLCAGQHGFGPSYMMIPLFFKQKISYVFHYISPLASDSQAETMCKDINNLLDQCALQSTLSLSDFSML